jgi:hypothetical protein
MRTVYIALSTAAVLSITVAVVPAADSPAIPSKAIAALEFFVGSWEGSGSETGEKIEGDRDVRSWAPGRHCITMKAASIEGGKRVQYSGLCGWDGKGKQLVEHWFTSEGLYVAIRYPLARMTDDIWDGTVTVTYAKGNAYDGTCRLQKTDEGFNWRCIWEEDGKEMVRESVARRVK